jgi:hypothetical protein
LEIKMIKLLLFFFFSLYCGQLFASKDLGLRGILTQFDSIGESSSKCSGECSDLLSKEKILLKQCAVDLCGSASSIAPNRLTDKDFQQFYQDPAITKDFLQFKPKIVKYARIIKERVQAEGKHILKNMQSDDYFNVDHYSVEQLTDFVRSELSSYLTTRVEELEHGESHIYLELDPYANTEPELTKCYLQYEQEVLEKNFEFGIQEGFFSVENRKEVLLKSIDKLHSAIAEKLKSSQLSKDKRERLKEMDSEYIKIGKNIEGEDELEYGDLIQYFFDIDSVDKQFPQEIGLQYFSSKPAKLKCDSKILKQFTLKRLKQVIKKRNIQVMMDRMDDQQEIKSLINKCEYFWHQHKINQGIADNKQKFEARLPRFIDNFIGRSVANFSSISAQQLGDYLKKLKIMIGDEETSDDMGRDYQFEGFLSEIEGVVESDPVSSKITTDTVALDDYRQLRYRLEVSPDAKYEMLERCASADRLLKDYMAPNYVYVSPYSFNNPEIGEAILDHELGHVVNNEFFTKQLSTQSQKKYKKLRQCVTNYHRDVEYEDGQDSLYSEEDMADFFSFLTFSKERGSLFSCSLLPQNRKGTQYAVDDLNLINQDPTDPHSSAMFRLLMEAKFKRHPLSSNCQKLIEQYRDKFNFKPCEL